MFRCLNGARHVSPLVSLAHRGIYRMRSTPAEGGGVLASKVALVTASTEGIGFAIARRLAQDGARVVLSSRHQENVDRAVKQLQSENLTVKGTVCNVGKEKDRERLVAMALDHYGGIDILVSHAGVNPFVGNIMDATEDIWDELLTVNVTTAFLLVKTVVPHMQKRGAGSIVMTSSAVAYSNVPSIGPYCVSKVALLGLTKALASELAPMNIRVNGVAPGFIKTKFSSGAWENEALITHLMQVHGFTRLGEPEECAGIVSFLCSPDASYINGENIVIGGGFGTRL